MGFCCSPLCQSEFRQRSAFLLPRAPVQHDGVLAPFVGVIPVVDVAVDLVPDPFAFDLGAVVEVQCSSCEVAKPQDVGVLFVAMVLVSLADQVLV